MIDVLIEQNESGFVWIDLVNPSESDLESIGQRFNLPKTALQDCMQKGHLPKWEGFEDFNFMIVRSFDENAEKEGDDIRELTNKLALFIGKGFVVTIRSREQSSFEGLRASLPKRVPKVTMFEVIYEFLLKTCLSYGRPIAELREQLDQIEERIFKGVPDAFALEDGYYLRRRASVIKQILRQSLDVIQALRDIPARKSSVFRHIKDEGESLVARVADVLDNINLLLNLYISISSQKTNEASHRINEVMRILTVFSAFFLPLNFIASIYGMNFEFMPELKMPYGYFGVLSVMALVGTFIFVWFWQRGWIWPKEKSTFKK